MGNKGINGWSPFTHGDPYHWKHGTGGTLLVLASCPSLDCFIDVVERTAFTISALNRALRVPAWGPAVGGTP